MSCKEEKIEGEITRIRMFSTKKTNNPAGFMLWTTQGMKYDFGVTSGTKVQAGKDRENEGVARIIGVDMDDRASDKNQANFLQFILAKDVANSKKNKQVKMPKVVEACNWGSECTWGTIMEGKLACMQCTRGAALSGVVLSIAIIGSTLSS